jgi:hypothetical protein
MAVGAENAIAHVVSFFVLDRHDDTNSMIGVITVWAVDCRDNPLIGFHGALLLKD